ncbi:sulfotransferase family protein [Actinosynnema sp. NPDC050436]|uniref:sulfotransferase-like domain-containing protein n=1 Tax=Actinosynnema sp. NPDC050436 TaxID=3155659 RepID=UPI0033EBA3A8
MSAAARIVALWSLPRSRSTAFFRMVLQRPDFLALHEPFSTRAELGSVDLGGQVVRTEDGVVDRLRALSRERPLFFKDTTDERYPAVLGDRAFLAGDVRSTFLIRHPAETIPSYYAVNPDVRPDQIGCEHLHELFSHVWRVTGERPVVIDAADLVREPESLVRAYFGRLGVPHLPETMSWGTGERAEWRATGRWHRDVAETTGFESRSARHGLRMADLGHLRGHLEHQLPFYEALRQHRLTV